MIKITNTEFVRDMASQAVLNTDIDGLQQFESTRKRLKAERADRLNTKERLKQLEQDMDELTALVKELSSLKGSHGNQ